MFSSKYSHHSAELAGIDCSAESFGNEVRSEFAQDCDINLIMSRYVKTGVIEHLNPFLSSFSDVSSLGDYSAMRFALSVAEDAFMQLPARVRELVGNDPARFLDFVSDPANSSAIVDLGLGQFVKAPPSQIDEEGKGDSPREDAAL